MSNPDREIESQRQYPSIYNPNGVYASYFVKQDKFTEAEQKLIKKGYESQRGYLDAGDIHEHYYVRRSSQTTRFSINILQEGKLIQFRLSWDSNFDIIDIMLIRIFHMLEPVLSNYNIVNEWALREFFLANNIKIRQVNTRELPSPSSSDYHQIINLVTVYSTAFAYHFVPDKGVCFNWFPLDIRDIKRIHIDFENSKNYKECAKLLRYVRLEKEKLFIEVEPTTFFFERKKIPKRNSNT